MEGNAPVPAIAAHIHEAATAIEPGLHRVPHLGRMIFGMRARHYHAVVFQKFVALMVQILIRDDVVIDAMMGKPAEQMRIGIILIEAGTVTAEPGVIARCAIDIWTNPAGIADTRPVGMLVIEGV